MARARSPVEDVIRTRVEEHPDVVWLKFRDETYAWAEVLSNIQRAANGLLDLGVRPGERVAILMGNRPEFIWVHLGIVFIGALSVPVNTSQRGATLEHILTDSDSVVVVFEDELRGAVLAVKDSLPSLRASVVADGKTGNGVDWTIDRLLDHPDAEPEVEVGDLGWRRGDDVHVAAALPRQCLARLHDRLDGPRREVRTRGEVQRVALLR